MTECVQRHDVAPEDLADGETLLAEMRATANSDLWLIGKIVTGIVAVHATAYLIAVLA